MISTETCKAAEIAAGLASELGSKWHQVLTLKAAQKSDDPDFKSYDCTRLTDGVVVLQVRVGNYDIRGRVQINASPGRGDRVADQKLWKIHCDHFRESERPKLSITVAETKTIAQICRDVVRRLLPEALAHALKVQAIVDRDNRAASMLQDDVSRFLAIAGTFQVNRDENDRTATCRWTGYRDGVEVAITRYGNDESTLVKLTLGGLDVDRAAGIVAGLRRGV